MKSIEIYQIDAFTDQIFGGNPAAVCPLEEWLDDNLLQDIAMENNLSETAFYVMNGDHYEIRWFTPTTEVDLCGHATLATAFVEFNLKGVSTDELTFKSKSGDLKVTREGENLCLDFPIDKLEKVDLTQEMLRPFQSKPIAAYRGKDDLLLVFESDQEILDMTPSIDLISKIDTRGVLVTAKGTDCDFVSRFFAPQSGIDEDPVTGSAHTTLIPYWSEQLNKVKLSARQLSKRGGKLECEKLNNERVKISGQAKLFLKGEILL